MADRELSLCSTCSKRQSDAAEFRKVKPRQCFICRGLTLRIPRIGERVLQLARRYQFRTFSVGMIVPADVQEREDKLRSDLQIRGMETIKSQITREVSDIVRRGMKKRVDRGHPDLTLLVDMTSDRVSATAKSVFVHARYTKPRGVSQRREFCEKCSGRGCDECDQGYARTPSVEVALGRRFCRIFSSSRAKFTWIGSEDEESVVFAPGRPFIVEMKDPRRREAPEKFGAATGRGRVSVTGVKVLKGRPPVNVSFVFITRASIESPEPLDGLHLNDARRLVGTTIEHRNNKGKMVFKRVYSIRLQRKGRKMVAEMKMDGGLPVKRLVSGESVSPSLSEVLGAPLSCTRFDILRVWESRTRDVALRTFGRRR